MAKSSTQPFFSIVIPTLNEEKYLPQLLKDLVKQTNNNFEVIHVDGSSEDKTMDRAAAFKKKLSLKSFAVNKRNVSYQRNYGAKKASGEWLIFMDADNRLPAHFLDGVKYQIAKNPDVDTFTTWISIEQEATKLNTAIERMINYSFELYKTMGKEVALGAMIGAKAKIFNKVKFDESQQVYEDTLFIQEATDQGFEFDVFKNPRYIMSLRRMEKEGKLRMLLIMTLLNLRFLQGKDFSAINHGYVMRGGSYYEDGPNSPLSNLQNYLKNTSKKQLNQARRLWRSIKAELEVK